MRKLFLFFALLLFAVAPLQAQQRKWTALNTILAMTSVGLQVVDCAQTVVLTRSPNIEESNPLLGRKPSILRVVATCTAAIAGNVILARTLFNPWRNASLTIVTMIETDMVWHNANVGVRFSVPL